MPETTPTRQHRRDDEPFTAADTPDRLYRENVELVRRITQLRHELEALTRENAQLRRRLSALKVENRHLTSDRGVAATATTDERVAHVRSMLRDPCSRNP